MAHVLVVEDDALQWQALSRHLVRAGHRVSWVSTAAQAIRFLRHEAAGLEPTLHLVVLDLELQGALSGLDVARHIPPRIVTVVASGHPREQILARVEQPLARVRVYFEKPFLASDLDRVLAHLPS